MDSSNTHVVIVGAGHAGGSVAGFLRQYGFEGLITLIGTEPIPPYQRPPLSKAWLKGEADADSLQLKDPSWWADNGCDLRLNQTVNAELGTHGQRPGHDLRVGFLVRRGRVVTNPSGGLLCKGHPLGATGLAQCYELTHQLRGTADKRQVKGARLALQHNLGLGGACVVTLYGRH